LVPRGFRSDVFHSDALALRYCEGLPDELHRPGFLERDDFPQADFRSHGSRPPRVRKLAPPSATWWERDKFLRRRAKQLRLVR
jgi:hypothetical protein